MFVCAMTFHINLFLLDIYYFHYTTLLTDGYCAQDNSAGDDI